MAATSARITPALTIDRERGRIAASGDWVVATTDVAEGLVAQTGLPGAAAVDIDTAAIGLMDTAGVWLLVRLREALITAGAAVTVSGMDGHRAILLKQVEAAQQSEAAAEAAEVAQPRKKVRPILSFLDRVGRHACDQAHDSKWVLSLLGAAVANIAFGILHPRRFRVTATLSNFERVCIGAVPIIALMSFLIGAIIAQQGAFYLRQFGAQLFVVDLVGVLALRELGVLLTAIMVAGRSGSAFTAEIGSMRMREEVDAIQVMGLNPVEVLVVPRLLALIVALPILTFIANIAALAGAGVVSWLYIGISMSTFLDRLNSAIDLQTLMIGISKAPFMALIVGLVSCVEGMKVKGSAESLGRQTTVSVVRSIFLVIVVDGIFAIIFASMGI